MRTTKEAIEKHREYNRRRYREDPEKFKEYGRQYRKSHREELKRKRHAKLLKEWEKRYEREQNTPAEPRRYSARGQG
jgi:hypothetical protein